MSNTIGDDKKIPHVLNYGMGVDSTAILLRWLHMSDEDRGFGLDQLVVLMAQTGDEYESTRALVETHVFPLLRKHNIRTVQVAKAGPSQTDGYVVLDDTTQPYDLHIEGCYKLSEHMRVNGTSVQYSGPHTCAMKFKGIVLDQWLEKEFNYDAFGPYLGYAKGEESRAVKCDGYKCRGQKWRFPLLDWGWTREDCLQYIYFHTGVVWKKSCCMACPFQKNSGCSARWKAEPYAASHALLTEYLSVAMNRTMTMFSDGSAQARVMDSDNRAAADWFKGVLDSQTWAVYRVRRTYERLPQKKDPTKDYNKIKRCVKQVQTGSKFEMFKALMVIAAQHGQRVTTDDYGISRVYTHVRPFVTPQVKPNPRRKHAPAPVGVFPAVEGFYVVAPAVINDKVDRPDEFEATWSAYSAIMNALTHDAPQVTAKLGKGVQRFPDAFTAYAQANGMDPALYDNQPTAIAP